ncbi:MAG: 2Fe-2S iron-sulfur cluster-binding protein [Panacagrimonas sp.]
MRMTLLPDGRTLSIEPGETLLNALRRQGEPISHSCEDGRCGLCRCELIFSDKALVEMSWSPDRADKSTVLACQAVPNANCLVELPDRNDVLVLPPQIARAQVVAVDSLADRVRQLRLRPGKALRFEAGQHFELGWSSNLIRMYSAASLATDAELNFHVQLHRYGRASRHLADVLKTGDSVRLRGPLGTTYLRRSCSAPILCISSNTGLGPMLALIRAIGEARMTNPVHIYAGFAMSEDEYGRAELERAAKYLPSLRRCQTVIGGGTLRRGDRRGLLTDVIAADLANLRSSRAYLFGSPHAVEATSRLLGRNGIAPERLHAEPFHYSGL